MIVTVSGVVTVVGAVYSPDELTAPAPVVGLIVQFTAVFVLPVTVAVNCCVPPALTLAEPGATVTVTDCGLIDMLSTGTNVAGIVTVLPEEIML